MRAGVDKPRASLQRSLEHTHALRVTFGTGYFESGGAVPTAAGVRKRREQLGDAGGVTVVGGIVNWRNAIVLALGHVALAGNKLLDDGGVTFLGGNANWRSAVVIALGHVALQVQVNLLVKGGEPR